MPIDLEDYYRRLFHGIPGSLDEQRAVMEKLTGKPFPKRKRCPKCNGEGTISDGKYWHNLGTDETYKTHKHNRGVYKELIKGCPMCQMTGFVPENTANDED